MTWVDDLELWFNRRRNRLEAIGDSKFVRDPTGRTNGDFAGVYVKLPRESVEVLVWRTGAVEFDRGPVDSPTLEHLDLVSDADFDSLMRAVEAYLRIDESNWSSRD